ncbi:hypothetical protein NIES2134_105310 [Thermostichus vulcanus NIES-2134]|nr:hypothetical protein NIES2134_105310 [Thermostichus vulcanus NIES-2134]
MLYSPQLFHYLEQELALLPQSIAMAVRQWQQQRASLPIILWQYGLMTLEQLDRIFEWLDQTRGDRLPQSSSKETLLPSCPSRNRTWEFPRIQLKPLHSSL